MKTLRNLVMCVLAVLAGSLLVDLAAAQGGGGRGGARGSTATTLKPATPGEKAPDAAGFIQRWLLLEPINVGNQQEEGPTKETLKKEFFPNELTIMPHDGDKVTVGGVELAWHALDTTLYNVNLYTFGAMVNKSSAGALFWAVTVVNCPQDMPNVRLAIGSNASSVWWVNGQQAAAVYGDRQTVIDDGVSRRLTLKKGPNVIRCAVINGSGATDFCARFLDEQDKPVKAFTISLSDAAK